MDKYKRLASNTLILAIGQFGSKFLVYIMMRFYTGQLGTDGYGDVGVIVDASTLIMAIVTLSVGESIVRFGLDAKYDNTQVFSIGMITTVLGVLFFAAIAPALTLVDFLSEYALLIYVYVFTGSIRNSCALFVRSAGYVRLFALNGIFTTAVNIVFNLILMLVFKMGVMGYVLSVVLADAVSTVFLFRTAKLGKYLRLRGLDRQLRRLMFSFCIPLIPTTVMWWVTNVSDGFFIREMLGKDATGIYKAAYKLPNVIALLSGIFSQAWNMSAITEKNSRTIARFYTNVFNIFQSVVYIISAGTLLAVKFLLGVMATQDFAESYRYAPLLVIAVIFTCFSTFMGSIYVASRKTIRSMTTAFGGAAANIALNSLLIPAMGIQGASLATVISYLIIFVSRAADSRKIVLMNLNMLKMTANMLFITAMCLVIIYTTDAGFYYASLSVGFLVICLINLRSGLAALYMVTRKKS